MDEKSKITAIQTPISCGGTIHQLSKYSAVCTAVILDFLMTELCHKADTKYLRPFFHHLR